MPESSNVLEEARELVDVGGVAITACDPALDADGRTLRAARQVAEAIAEAVRRV